MTVDEIKKYCIDKPMTTEEYPFGDIPICYKLNGKIFAQLYPKSDRYMITLKCSPQEGEFYRTAFPGIVVRGYHCPPIQQPYWNTVYLDNFPDNELKVMIDMAYDAVFKSFSKKVQEKLLKTIGNI